MTLPPLRTTGALRPAITGRWPPKMKGKVMLYYKPESLFSEHSHVTHSEAAAELLAQALKHLEASAQDAPTPDLADGAGAVADNVRACLLSGLGLTVLGQRYMASL